MNFSTVSLSMARARFGLVAAVLMAVSITSAHSAPVFVQDVVAPASLGSPPIIVGTGGVNPLLYMHDITDQGFVPGVDTIVNLPSLPSLTISLLDNDEFFENIVIVLDGSPITVVSTPIGLVTIDVDISDLADGKLNVGLNAIPDPLPTSPPLPNNVVFGGSRLDVAYNDVPEPGTLALVAVPLIMLAGALRLSGRRRQSLGPAYSPS